MNDKFTYRRNLSGIYIFDVLPHDKGKRFPTCIEDCNEETRLKWLNGLEAEAIVRTGQHLNECFCRLWDMLTEEETKAILKATNGNKPYCETTSEKWRCIRYVNIFCEILRNIADLAGICAPDSEAATGIPLSEEDD